MPLLSSACTCSEACFAAPHRRLLHAMRSASPAPTPWPGRHAGAPSHHRHVVGTGAQHSASAPAAMFLLAWPRPVATTVTRMSSPMSSS